LDEEKSMNMAIPRGKIEWNLNTLLQVITLVTMLAGGVSIWVNASRDIEELRAWRSNHEQYHKDRLAETKGIEARNDERLKSIEGDVRKLTGVTDNLSYRITTNEQTTSSTTQTVKEIQASLAQQAGDLRVIKEILQRLEAGQKRSVP